MATESSNKVCSSLLHWNWKVPRRTSPRSALAPRVPPPKAPRVFWVIRNDVILLELGPTSTYVRNTYEENTYYRFVRSKCEPSPANLFAARCSLLPNLERQSSHTHPTSLSLGCTFSSTGLCQRTLLCHHYLVPVCERDIFAGTNFDRHHAGLSTMPSEYHGCEL